MLRQSAWKASDKCFLFLFGHLWNCSLYWNCHLAGCKQLVETHSLQLESFWTTTVLLSWTKPFWRSTFYLLSTSWPKNGQRFTEWSTIKLITNTFDHRNTLAIIWQDCCGKEGPIFTKSGCHHCQQHLIAANTEGDTWLGVIQLMVRGGTVRSKGGWWVKLSRRKGSQ